MLETFLKAYITQLPLPEQWIHFLPLAEFTYNATKYKVIGMSLFELILAIFPDCL
jgi:hypothetical protein